MQRYKIINVSGLGWTGSTLLVEIFEKLKVGLYHDEFNFLRHPSMAAALKDNDTRSFIKVCLTITRSCASNFFKKNVFFKSKILTEILVLLTLCPLSLVIRNNILARLYVNACFFLYSKNKILMLDQLWFPEDLQSEIMEIEKELSFEIFHIFVFRKNFDKAFSDRRQYFDFLSPKTLREKFFFGWGGAHSYSIICGQLARRLFFKRKKIVERTKLQNLKHLYFEDLVMDTENVITDVLEFIDEQQLLSKEYLETIVRHASKSRENL